MGDEINQVKWVGVRSTSPESDIPVKPSGGAANFPVDIKASAGTVNVFEQSPLTSIQVEPKAGAANLNVNLAASGVDQTIKPSASPFVHAVQPGAWASVYQGVTRTQIVKYADANNATVICHTVLAGKTFYLTGLILTSVHSAATVGVCMVRDASDIFVFRLATISTYAAGEVYISHVFPMPIIVPAGFDIVNWQVNGMGSLSIQGWEE